MNTETLRGELGRQATRFELIDRYCRGKRVLDLGCVDHNLPNAHKDRWLHGRIVSCAERTVGVDYAATAVEELRRQGYEIIRADVTRPLDLNERFEVVVIGNLIEHLSNFAGLFENITRTLEPGGVVLISTNNPFYIEQYFYSAFKNDIIVNEVHTCWLDPVTLDQLARRFGLHTIRVHWIRERWKLHHVIMHGTSRRFDILTGEWEFHRGPTLFERSISAFILFLFMMIRPARAKEVICRRGRDKARRLLFLMFSATLFGILWFLYRQLIRTSPMNRHELFLSVLMPSEPVE